MCFKSPQRIAVVRPPKQNIIVTQVLIILKPPRKLALASFLCLFLFITSQNYSFNEKPKMENTIKNAPNSRWHAATLYPVPVFV